MLWARVCGCGGPTLSPWPACPVGAACRGGGGGPSPRGLACHRCEGRLVSGAVPPPAARPLERAARVPRPVCPRCGRCGRGDPAPAPQRAPLRAGFAGYGGGGRASLGGPPSTILLSLSCRSPVAFSCRFPVASLSPLALLPSCRLPVAFLSLIVSLCLVSCRFPVVPLSPPCRRPVALLSPSCRTSPVAFLSPTCRFLSFPAAFLPLACRFPVATLSSSCRHPVAFLSLPAAFHRRLPRVARIYCEGRLRSGAVPPPTPCSCPYTHRGGR